MPLVRPEVSYQLRNYYLCTVPCSPTSPVLVAMRLPTSLLQVMGDELDVQIKTVEAEITKVVREIEEVKEQLKPFVARLAGGGLPGELRDELLEERKRLDTEKQRLGTKEELLRKKELLLTAKLLPPGVVPLLFVFIVYASLRPFWLQAVPCAHASACCPLPLPPIIGFISWNWAQTTASSN